MSNKFLRKSSRACGPTKALVAAKAANKPTINTSGRIEVRVGCSLKLSFVVFLGGHGRRCYNRSVPFNEFGEFVYKIIMYLSESIIIIHHL